MNNVQTENITSSERSTFCMQMLLKRSDCHFMPRFVMIVFSVYKRIPKHLDQTTKNLLCSRSPCLNLILQ